MSRRERLERALAGERVDRAPVALWRHFPGDDQRSADQARSIVDFQRAYNWDFVRVMPARAFLVSDYGLQDAWRGNARGFREIDKRVVSRSLDWTELRPLSPNRGALARQLECLRLVSAALDDDTPILQSIYSPLLQAAQLAGRQKTLRDLRLRPDRLRSGLTHLTETAMRFIEALADIKGVAGIFLVTGFASHDRLSESEYAAIAMPHLRRILDNLPGRFWLNIAQAAGASPMLRLLGTLPIQALNWDVETADLSLSQARGLYAGAVCGGLSDRRDLLLGTPGLLRESINDALRQCDSRRLILSGGGEGYITAPLGNLRAVASHIKSAP